MLLVSAAASVVALGVYLINGRPDLPGGAYAERIAALKQRPSETYNADEWLAVLGDDARANPSDPWPMLATGEVLLRTNRPQEAARAFDTALRRNPRSVDALIGVARSIALMKDASRRRRWLSSNKPARSPMIPRLGFIVRWRRWSLGREANTRRCVGAKPILA